MEIYKYSIVEYSHKYKNDYIKLNLKWLKEHNLLEEKDEIIIENVEDEVISKGGKVYILKKEEEVVGTIGLIPNSFGSIEIIKLAVDKNHTGLGLGKKLMKKAISESYKMGFNKIILYTNSILKPAIGLYEKLGFKRVKLDDNSDYEKVDVKMVYDFNV
ncbi:GNAT family N-acetyltransferase [Clostridium oceanicum]|uniref:N-acetyltransferase domain-containing protein n=1 Tax=Clostridium oceanicum TaxID=1543 RepID=A0ABP3UH46_9CLOT